MEKPNILIIGSIFMDLIFEGIPKLAEFGESISCKSYSYVPGGKGANQAVAAARAGACVTMVGHLGDDYNGHILWNNLNNLGINMQDTPLNPNTLTGLAPVLIEEKSGKYASYNVMGGNNLITPEQVKQALNRQKYDMILIQLEMPLETVYQTFEMASKQNIPVFLDAGPAMTIPLERLHGIFVISPNEVETKALTGILPDTLEHAQKAAQKIFEIVHPCHVILKLGARGAFYYNGITSKLIPAFQDITAIDSTAAGDTFGGAFATAYCNGMTILDAICYANAAAAICVSRKGGEPAIPTASEIYTFLEAHNISLNTGGF